VRGYLQRRTAYHCYPPPASQLRQFCFKVWRGVSRLEGLCTRDWVAKWGVILVGDQDLRARKGFGDKERRGTRGVLGSGRDRGVTRVHANSCPCEDRHAAKRGVGVRKYRLGALELYLRFEGALDCWRD
jgi:hypothetical protein